MCVDTDERLFASAFTYLGVHDYRFVVYLMSGVLLSGTHKYMNTCEAYYGVVPWYTLYGGLRELLKMLGSSTY